MRTRFDKSMSIQILADLEIAAEKRTGSSRCLSFAASLLVVMVAVCGRAGEIEEETKPQPVQELFRTDLVYPQEAREIQFTLAPTFLRERGADVFELLVSVEYGLTDAWQVEVEWAAFLQRNPKQGRTTRGVGDLEFGTQYSFMNIMDSSFHVAPRFGVQFPVGSINKELTEGFIEYEPSLILAKDFAELHNAQIFAQIGVSFVQRMKRPADADDQEPAAHEINWNTGFFVPFTHWVASVELSGSNNRWNNGGEENQIYLTPGCVWKPSRSAEIGVGVSIGLNQGSDDFQVITQLTYEF